MISYEGILIFIILIILLFINFTNSIAFPQVKNLPVKIDLEIKRTPHFLKMGVILKNESGEPQFVKVKLVILKKNKANVSRIAQSKELNLSGYEMTLPIWTEFSVNSQDSFEIRLQLYDREGNLITERIFESTGSGNDRKNLT